MAAARPSVAPQSETTAPSKPHSSRRTWVRSSAFVVQYIPFNRLYAAITMAGRLAITAYSKLAR